MERVMRVKDVAEVTGLAVGSVYRRIRQGTFPPGAKLGGRARGWKESDISAWVEKQFQESA